MFAASSTIHGLDGTLRAHAEAFSPQNNNALRLAFTSSDDWHKAEVFELQTFGLDDTTARGLYAFLSLSEEKRAAILPALEHALDEQNAEAEVDAEEMA